MSTISYVDTLIIPLLRMFESAYNKSVENVCNTTLIIEILKYVNKNYTQNITLKQLCTEYSRSRSYISHNFKKVTGQYFQEYLTNLRPHSAEYLLYNLKLTVTEISESLGFCNSSYFSSQFKFRFGIYLREYHKPKTTSLKAEHYLHDIGTEELGHLEMVGTLVSQLSNNVPPKEWNDMQSYEYYADNGTSVFPQSSQGVPFSAASIAVTGDPITNLYEDLAADGTIL